MILWSSRASSRCVPVAELLHKDLFEFIRAAWHSPYSEASSCGK